MFPGCGSGKGKFGAMAGPFDKRKNVPRCLSSPPSLKQTQAIRKQTATERAHTHADKHMFHAQTHVRRHSLQDTHRSSHIHTQTHPHSQIQCHYSHSSTHRHSHRCLSMQQIYLHTNIILTHVRISHIFIRQTCIKHPPTKYQTKSLPSYNLHSEGGGL